MFIQMRLIERSVRVQNSEQSTLASRVVEPLKKGLSSISILSEMVLRVETDAVDSGSQTHNEVRQEIVKMKENFEESEQIVSAELEVLDGKTESLTAEKNVLEREKETREAKLFTLNKELEGHKSSLNTYKKAIETERTILHSAKETLKNMREKRDEAETLRNVGIGMFAIPFVGWIAGSVMVGVGQTDLNMASEQVDRAQTEVQKCQSQINFYSQKVFSCERQITETQSDIQWAKYRISEAQIKLEALSEERRMVSDLQNKTRRAVHHVGLLCGVGSVAELQTRRLILLEPMMKVMEDMLAALGQITGDDLLHTDMRRIMTDLRINHRRLEADRCTDTSDEDYY